MAIGILQASHKPWEVFDWPTDHQQAIYRDWGQYYARNQRTKSAIQSLNQALALKPNDWRVLYARSKCKRTLADPTGALEDSCMARDIIRRKSDEQHQGAINFEILDAIYELNKFEDCLGGLYNNYRSFGDRKESAKFANRIAVVDENIKETLADSIHPFILKNEKNFHKVSNIMSLEKNVDARPLWKILKEQEKCDVQSIPDIKIERLSPLERSRRMRASEVFAETYLNRSWIDVLFLKNLRKNPNLLLPQCVESTPYLAAFTQTNNAEIRKFLKMLQCRSPMYNEKCMKFPNKKLMEQHRERYLNRVQYQTQRTMKAVLRNIRELRNNKRINELTNYVEEVMGDYIVLKTDRVMCWKFEFVNEVYNLLALSFTDQYRVPANLIHDLPTRRLFTLFNLPTRQQTARADRLQFGNKASFTDPEKIDPKTVKYMKTLERLDHRMSFAKYAIEKCYLLHAIGELHLKQGRLSECYGVAKRGIEEAKKCNNHIWRFLCTILICKANAILHQVERGKESCSALLLIATKLRSVKLCSFAEACYQANTEEMELKKKSRSMENIRRRKSASVLSNLN